MRYSLWIDQRRIGETRFELCSRGSKRAGIFRPTDFGATVLPAIADMFPALIAFGELCRREGVDVDDDSRDGAAAALESFGGTEEGQRVVAAAKRIARIEVRDPSGRLMHWESLAISDLEMLARLSGKKKPGARNSLASAQGSGIYIISLTLAARRDRGLADSEHFGAQRREPAPH
jgi:hypothetical protein